MAFEFISKINESKLICSKDYLEDYSARDIADGIFLYFLALSILRFENQKEADSYANKTISWGDFNDFRSSTDLYVLIYTLFGKNNESAKILLADQKDSLKLIEKVNFNISGCKTWLRNLQHGRKPLASDRRFIMDLETNLNITVENYKSMRRLILDWNELDHGAKESVMTRLLFAFRSRFKRSELLPILEKIALKKDLEIKDAKNPELKESDESIDALNDYVNKIQQETKDAEAYVRNYFEQNNYKVGQTATYIQHEFSLMCDSKEESLDTWNKAIIYKFPMTEEENAVELLYSLNPINDFGNSNFACFKDGTVAHINSHRKQIVLYTDAFYLMHNFSVISQANKIEMAKFLGWKPEGITESSDESSVPKQNKLFQYIYHELNILADKIKYHKSGHILLPSHQHSGYELTIDISYRQHIEDFLHSLNPYIETKTKGPFSEKNYWYNDDGTMVKLFNQPSGATGTTEDEAVRVFLSNMDQTVNLK